jgi:hypothetical protein
MGQVFQLMRDYARHRGHRLSDVAARIIDGTIKDELPGTRRRT